MLVNAAPIPWINRSAISQPPELAKPHSNDDTVKITTPHLKSLRIPVRSPQRPTGSKNMAVASRNDVTTQLKLMAFSPIDLSMAGKAMLIDDIRNVPMNDVMATMARMETCFFVQCIIWFCKDLFIKELIMVLADRILFSNMVLISPIVSSHPSPITNACEVGVSPPTLGVRLYPPLRPMNN